MTPKCQAKFPYALEREKTREKHRLQITSRLFRARRVLGDGLGAFRHGVLGKLAGKDEADRGLDLAGRDGGLLVVGSKLGSLGSDTLEDICYGEIKSEKTRFVCCWIGKYAHH